MNTVTVRASKTYDVLIGEDLLKHTGAHILGVHAPCRTAIISDSNVWPVYGSTVKNSLENAGFTVSAFVFPAGESSKNAETYISILNFLAQEHITRSDLIIALGGGVTGDMAGFAAATFLRGISYVQLPTTLLAMVDSSVGGKTAIDLQIGKNLVGAFHQPCLVLCDILTLSTLPKEVFTDGCAEVIKYGILYDNALFDHLRNNRNGFDREYVITRCVELKRDVVAEDEFDTGLRQKLNLGHTVGHAIEAQSNYAISHGNAVAMGMAIVARSAHNKGICSKKVSDEICSAITAFNLPIDTDYDAEQLLSSVSSDKKCFGNSVNLIVPVSIGSCEIMPISVSELQSFIKAGL